MKIIDDFFDNPLEVRNRGLEYAKELDYKFPFMISDNGAWPGFRICSNRVGKEKMLEIVGNSYVEKIKSNISEDIDLDQVSVQWVSSIWTKGAVHTDYPNDHISITYLNEDPPPNSGTEVYPNYKFEDLAAYWKNNEKSKLGSLLYPFDRHKQAFYMSNKNEKKRKYYLPRLEKLNGHFKDPIIASNKFNRNIIYDSRLLHRAQDFFGDDLNDLNSSRMSVVSFWNDKK
tara:strand:- start:241 stop:927 length:687 start_codon:yes stop_codon:yes gene_type:complete